MTSIAAVKAALVTLLDAALPSTQVIPGPVDVTTLSSRLLVVGSESTPIQFDPTNLTGTSGAATYTLTLTASVSLSGTSLAASETLAQADFAAAVAAIQADETIGLTNVSATVSGSGELVEKSDATGRQVDVRFPVVVYTTL